MPLQPPDRHDSLIRNCVEKWIQHAKAGYSISSNGANGAPKRTGLLSWKKNLLAKPGSISRVQFIQHWHMVEYIERKQPCRYPLGGRWGACRFLGRRSPTVTRTGCKLLGKAMTSSVLTIDPLAAPTDADSDKSDIKRSGEQVGTSLYTPLLDVIPPTQPEIGSITGVKSVSVPIS
jgi:hypothetical protein